MKKIILSLLLIICLTGCTATYNLTIDKNGVNENLKISSTSLNENSEIYEYYLPLYINDSGSSETNEKIEGVEYYNSAITTNNSLKELTYQHNFSVDNYLDSTIINSCFNKFYFNQYNYDEDENQKYIRISNSSDFNCFDTYPSLEKVNINIEVKDYEVIESNATSVHDNVYSWTITPTNQDTMYLIYNPGDTSDKEQTSIFDNSLVLYFSIILAAALVIFIIYKIFKTISQNKDKAPQI